jgi:general secretion pathway protein E
MATITRLPYPFAKRHGVFIRDESDSDVTVVHRDPISLDLLAELKRVTQKTIQLEQISPERFQESLSQAYQTDTATAHAMLSSIEEDMDLNALAEQLPQAEDLLDSQDDAPVIRLLNAVLTQAVKSHASDVHIETFEDELIVRYRIDGILRQVLSLQRLLAPLIISRIKVMAKLDIAEKRLPQDGRITLRIAGHNVDVRVSTLPANHGERVVLRILDKKAARLQLDLLGMHDEQLQMMRRLIAHSHGIVLVTGPTGSGKTTSLYAMLTELNQPARNILTVEDPIEYDLPGIGQTQVNTKVEMTFAKGLRAILRQDPDVVMVGEIRDLETAEISVQASLTGHLVLSTLHTNSAVGAVTRLQDMGVEPFLLSSSLVGIIAQRLVRKLCLACRSEYTPDEQERQLLKLKQGDVIYQANGCGECTNLGYQGRTGIYEVIEVTAALRQLIHQKAAERTLAHKTHEHTSSILEDGLRLVRDGVTTLEEVLRVVNVE